MRNRKTARGRETVRERGIQRHAEIGLGGSLSEPGTCRWVSILVCKAERRGFQPRCILIVISPDFPLELTAFFPGKHLIHFLVLKIKDFRNFVLDNCILNFDAEQVYLKPQVINLKNKEVTVNPKPQTLEKNWFFENPIP